MVGEIAIDRGGKGEFLAREFDCPASAPMRQNGKVEEGRISGHRSH
jgi:hypothetical protein